MSAVAGAKSSTDPIALVVDGVLGAICPRMARTTKTLRSLGPGYETVLADVVGLVEEARRASARSVNALITATYWTIGRRIVEQEQHGHARADYGAALVDRLAADLTARFRRGFGRRNLFQMRAFYLAYREIPQTVSAQSMLLAPATKVQTASALSNAMTRGGIRADVPAFPLPWSHYVRLLGVRSSEARRFYETEALRGGWTIRQLDRQIGTQFYERTALSRNKAAMLRREETPKPHDAMAPEEEIKDPYVLEFLALKDEYSETDLEAALIAKIESFLLELGGDFAFVGRQRRLRVGDTWYRIDLLFFHRRLRCLVIIDLKLDRFTHADAGQMHLYLNYAREHWMLEGENPPVGLILCAEKDSAVARYALEGLPNKVLAAEYRTALPKEGALVAELEQTIQRYAAARSTRRARSKR
jgi:predicted nuclease of restriction endonuclease-like (RecB) superfamily